MNGSQSATAREIERASWSQGILTLVSILIGVALSIAVGRTQELKSIDLGYALRLLAFCIYCVTVFWYYHRFSAFFYRRASIFSILLPSIVGSALIATAHAIGDSQRFAVWTLVLLTGGAYSFAATAINCARGKFRIIEALEGTDLLRRFGNAMARSAIFLALMSSATAAMIWGGPLPGAVDLDTALCAVNGGLFAFLSLLNWIFFTRPLERVIDGVR